VQNCDCSDRIRELERLLNEARELYAEAQEKIRKEEERQKWMRAQAAKQVRGKHILARTSH